MFSSVFSRFSACRSSLVKLLSGREADCIVEAIPLQLALDCTETAINNSTIELPLPTDDLMDLLNLCLTSTYFQYNGKHYKQLHGTAMGSPVSIVVAEIVMQNIEELALATYKRTLPLWLRYVDDTFTAVHKDEIDDFHEHLNGQNADILFQFYCTTKYLYCTTKYLIRACGVRSR